MGLSAARIGTYLEPGPEDPLDCLIVLKKRMFVLLRENRT
jgi:hypothetical protein